MLLILGGAYQGKLSWAQTRFCWRPEDLCDLSAGYVPGKKCYYHLEALTRLDPMPDAPDLMRADAVIAREIGSGVVPMDAGERAWRERHGALLRRLAGEAGGVVRIFCGLPEVLK